MVNVEITDVNDNSPIFNPPFYEVSVLEDTMMDELLEKVNASDADQGTNGEITYAIFGGNVEDAFYIKSPSVRGLERNCLNFFRQNYFGLTCNFPLCLASVGRRCEGF